MPSRILNSAAFHRVNVGVIDIPDSLDGGSIHPEESCFLQTTPLYEPEIWVSADMFGVKKHTKSYLPLDPFPTHGSQL